MQNNATYRMYENEVDQLFGSKLENYPLPDAHGDWEDIQKRLDARDNQRKKPVMGKWLLALLLLSGITTGVIYFGSSSQKETTAATMAQREQPATVPAHTNAEQVNNTGAADNNTVSNNNIGETQQGNGTNTPVETTVDVNEEKNNSNNNINNTNTNPAASANNTSNINTAAGNITGGREVNRKPSPGTRNRATPVFSNKQKTGTATVTNNTRKEKRVSAVLNDGDQNDDVTGTDTDAAKDAGNVTKQGAGKTAEPVADVTASAQQPATAVIYDLPQPKTEEPKPAEVTTTTTSILNTNAAADQNLAKNTPKTKTKKTRTRREAPEHEYYSGMQGKWYLEAFSGYNNSIKQDKSFAAFLAPAGYVEKRLNQENALVSLQAGVNIKYRRNHFIFGTGLSYLELGDMVNYDASYSGNIALNANGRSKLTYLEIPISAGYDWASKRWGFSLQGGISAGVLLGAKGQYVSLNSFSSELFDLNSNKSTFRKTQLNLLVTPSVNYFLNGNTNVFVSPLYRLNLQPVTATGAAINQKYYGMGLRVGIRTTLR